MDQTSAKRTVKFLATCNDPSTFRQVVRSAPDSVVKSICNASLNALAGDVLLTDAQRKHLHKYRRSIIYLTSKKELISRKRALLESKNSQVGGFAFVPLLLNSVLGSLGTAFLSAA
jgi:hypothetical protein